MMNFLVLLLFPLLSHDMPIATYRVFENKDELKLEIVMDVQDVSDVLSVDRSELQMKDVSDYLQDHFQLKLNSLVCRYQIEKFDIEEDHFRVIGVFLSPPKNIVEVKISNHCLINVPHQANIIQLRVKDKLRDFHMNKKRQEIRIEC